MADEDTAPSVPEIPAPVWHEYNRTVTVQAYQVPDDNHTVITIEGKQNVAAGNWVVNEAGFVSVIDDETFIGLYPDAAADDKKGKKVSA